MASKLKADSIAVNSIFTIATEASYSANAASLIAAIELVMNLVNLAQLDFEPRYLEAQAYFLAYDFQVVSTISSAIAAVPVSFTATS